MATAIGNAVKKKLNNLLIHKCNNVKNNKNFDIKQINSAKRYKRLPSRLARGQPSVKTIFFLHLKLKSILYN